MVQALGSNYGLGIDAEYMRMMAELRSFGIAPSGNKNMDAQKLAQAKAELIQRIHKKDENNSESLKELGVQVINQVDESENTQRSEMEEQRLGAMTVAELNKIYFGL